MQLSSMKVELLKDQENSARKLEEMELAHQKDLSERHQTLASFQQQIKTLKLNHVLEI